MKTPQASRETVLELAREEWARSGPDLPFPDYVIVAFRGYWPQSMGPTPGNDPGVWDDAWYFIAPGKLRKSDANTDPSRYGWNSGADKPMAVLNTGCWPFRRGPHKGRTPALRQFTEQEARKAKVPDDGRFSVTRTYKVGDPRNYVEGGYYAINCHPGGVNGTSSEGCQTLPRDVADEFLWDVWKTTESAGVDVIWYILINGPIS